MREDKEWNATSPEDQMIMALVSVLESTQSKKDDKKKDSKKDKDKSKKDDKNKDKENKDPKVKLTNAEKWKQRDDRLPEWKKVAPKDGEAKEKEVDGRTYYWCTKCRGGKGMWALHKVHDDNHKHKFRKNKDGKEKDGKAVSFADAAKKGNDSPSIQVNKELLGNARAYLAKLKDFQ